MLQIRKASSDDFEIIMNIYRYAQDFMIKTGNPNQWGHFYPSDDIIKSDIRKGLCMTVCDENEIHAVFALMHYPEPTYSFIEGKWLNDEDYITIHRVAGDGRIHGIVGFIADYCKKLSGNVRIDTHHDNKIMQRQLEKNGFVKCGTIYLEDGNPRLAYHWSSLKTGK